MLDTTTILIVILVITAWPVPGALAAAHAIMYKRDPKGAALWTLTCLTVPVLGPWAYLAFGINRVERRAAKLWARRSRPAGGLTPAEASTAHPMDAADIIGPLTVLQTVAGVVTRRPLVGGNELTPLHNGEAAYPEMLGAIRTAQRSVTLASYIFDWDAVGREFTETLGAAARRGVKVHVLLDGLGAVTSFSRVGRRLLRSGAEVSAFFPLRFPFGRMRLNLRNHRKILVVDGLTGFTGGMNISQRHWLLRPGPDRSEDLHFCVLGPVVAQMQQAFAEDWLFATGEKLSGDGYFPSPTPRGTAWCRGISSGPDEDLENIHWMIQVATASAQRSVWIVTPYFVPSMSVISTMTMAAARGVEVRLVLPSVTDVPFMRWAADAYLWQVLEHGVRVFHRPPPFVHTKLMIVDDRWVLLGSANMDRRSFRLNFEFNLEVYQPPLAESLATWLRGVADGSREVTLEEMDRRPRWRRFRDGFVKLFSPYL